MYRTYHNIVLGIFKVFGITAPLLTVLVENLFLLELDASGFVITLSVVGNIIFATFVGLTSKIYFHDKSTSSLISMVATIVSHFLFSAGLLTYEYFYAGTPLNIGSILLFIMLPLLSCMGGFLQEFSNRTLEIDELREKDALNAAKLDETNLIIARRELLLKSETTLHESNVASIKRSYAGKRVAHLLDAKLNSEDARHYAAMQSIHASMQSMQPVNESMQPIHASMHDDESVNESIHAKQSIHASKPVHESIHASKPVHESIHSSMHDVNGVNESMHDVNESIHASKPVHESIHDVNESIHAKQSIHASKPVNESIHAPSIHAKKSIHAFAIHLASNYAGYATKSLPQNEIASALNISQSTVSRRIKALAQADILNGHVDAKLIEEFVKM